MTRRRVDRGESCPVCGLPECSDEERCSAVLEAWEQDDVDRDRSRDDIQDDIRWMTLDYSERTGHRRGGSRL